MTYFDGGCVLRERSLPQSLGIVTLLSRFMDVFSSVSSFPEPAQFKNPSSRTFAHQGDRRVFLATLAAQVWGNLAKNPARRLLSYISAILAICGYFLPFLKRSTGIYSPFISIYHPMNIEKQDSRRCRMPPGAVRHLRSITYAISLCHCNPSFATALFQGFE
jgi:hypothetical protein